MKLRLVIALVLFTSPLAVNAATFNVPASVQGTSLCADLTDTPTGYSGLMADSLYFGTYPDETTLIAGGATSWVYDDYCGFTTANLTEGPGEYWVKLRQLSSPNDVFYARFAFNGSKTLPVNLTVNQQLPNTRFVDANINATTSSIASSTFVEFDIGYYLELSELNQNQVNKNPQVIMVTIVQAGNPMSEGRAIPITPWSQGYSTSTMTWGSLLDGQYTGRITFSSADSIVGGVEVFPYTYLYVDFEVDNGTLITERWDAPYQGGQYNVEDDPTQLCSAIQSTPARWGCELVTWLFIPQGGFTGAVATLFDSDKFPWAQQAVQVLTMRGEYLQSEGSGTASGLTVTIHASTTQGLVGDLEIFNIQNVFDWIPTGTQEIIRAIILLGIVFAFLKMIYETIDNGLTLLSGTPRKSRFDTINGL